MKKIFIYAIAAVTAVSLSLTSCNKYEEGPGFTVRTAKARITGDWKLTKFTVNGTDYTSSAGTITMSIKKDGSYTYTWTSGSLSATETGTWDFNGDKTQVTFTETSPGSGTQTVTILELRSKEIMFREVDGSFTNEFTYTAQ